MDAMCVVTGSSSCAPKLVKELSTAEASIVRNSSPQAAPVYRASYIVRIMSFGFSVGDFLNGATLAYDLIGALLSTRGSSLEYQQLIRELEIVRLTCVQIDNLRSSQQISHSLLNALTHLVRACNEQMEQCAASVECYKESLQPGGSGNTVADSWKKVGWGLFKPKVIRDMRDCLQLKISCMNTLLSVSGCQEITQGIAVHCPAFRDAIKDDWSHFEIFCKIIPPTITQATRQRSDPLYRVREEPEKFFRLGQVFAIIDTAEYDKALRNIGEAWHHRPDVDNPFVGPVSVRKLVVVRSGVSSCLCLGVHNYHGKGCVEQDRQDLHSIIYSTRDPPPLITFTVPTTDPETKETVVLDESLMVNKPIKMEADHPSNMLVLSSRINYTRIHQLDFKMRVKPLGQVVIESIQDLSDQFQEALSALRAQSVLPPSRKSSELTTPVHEKEDAGNGFNASSFCTYIWACCQCSNEIPTLLSDCCVMQNCRHGRCDACAVAKQCSLVGTQVKDPSDLPGLNDGFSDKPHIVLPPIPLFSKPVSLINVEEISEV